MKNLILITIFALFSISVYSQVLDNNRVITTIDSTNRKEIVLIQEFSINVPLDSVWNAYTTKEGWENWAVPLAEVDFKVSGLIRTNYNKQGTIGDSSTIVLHVVNYVPRKLITLQAELNAHFPEFMKKDEKDFYNLIYFEKIDRSLTKVVSYGIGYKNSPKYHKLLKFFISGNEMSYKNLIQYLETGKPVKL